MKTPSKSTVVGKSANGNDITEGSSSMTTAQLETQPFLQHEDLAPDLGPLYGTISRGNRSRSDGLLLRRTGSKTMHNDPALRSVLRNPQNLSGSTRILQNYQNQMRNENAAWINLSYQSIPDEGGQFLSSVGTDSAEFQSTTSESIDFPAADTSKGGKKGSIYDMGESLTHSLQIAMEKVNRGFFADARSLTEGTIPQSIVLALCIGICCGFACYIYYSALMFLLELLWHRMPQNYIVGVWAEQYYVLWIPIVCYSCCILVGVCVIVLGEPGDLPFTISCIHEKGYIPMDHVMPMVVASIFSVVSGGSLGPEAPLVAICGALGGFISRHIFGQSHKNLIRKHSLMGMAGALAAFFGTPLGGSLFALEVNSRFGVEYYEHMVESIFCGEISLVVFRMLTGLDLAPIWNIYTNNDTLTAIDTGEAQKPMTPMMTHAEPWTVIAGGGIGLLGAAMGYLFCLFHWAQMTLYEKWGLLDNRYAFYRAMLGGLVIVMLGMLIPHTMFWGEYEFDQLVTMAPSSELPHVWPTSGLLGFEMDTPLKAFVVGLCKLVAISCTVAAGLRGGYIFPLFAAGGIFGRVLCSLFPPNTIPVPVAILCFSAGVNVAITRTALATTLILAFLAGEPCAIPAILAASLCSLFATAYVPFIKTQIARSDLDHSLYHQERVSYDVDT